jgi:hypothetical protein
MAAMQSLEKPFLQQVIPVAFPKQHIPAWGEPALCKPKHTRGKVIVLL